MKRIHRQDRMHHESLEDKYGTKKKKKTTKEKTNKKNNIKKKVITPQEAVLDFIKYIEGVRIRLRELHWSAERNSKHMLTDDIISSLDEFEDNVAEDFMGVCGFRIQVGTIVPTMTNQVELSALLCELHDAVVQLCACLENDKLYTGIVNELDDLMHDIGKWKYLETFK